MGCENWTAQQWARVFFKSIVPFWGLPDTLISDRDVKFTSAFWRALFEYSQTELAMTTAYHPQADGQSERTNQTVEHALRCLLAGRLNQDEWEDCLPSLQHVLLTSISATTDKLPYELLFGRTPRGTFSSPVPPSNAEQFLQQRQVLWREAADAIALSQARMKIYYDADRVPPQFGDYVYLRLTRPGQLGYHVQNQTKLSCNRLGPLRVIRPVGSLAYEVEFPAWYTGVHPVVSIEWLEPVIDDPFHRVAQIPPGPLIVEQEDGKEVPKYIIERILAKRRFKRPGARQHEVQYLVQWMGYGEKTWEPAASLQRDVPTLVDAFERQ